MSEADYPGLDSIAKKIADEKQPFERLEMTKEELLEMFAVRGHCPSPLVRRWGVLPLTGRRLFPLRCNPHADQYNPLKVHFIKEKIPDGGSSTVYRCGTLIDLCLGPHVTNTSRIKAFAVHKVRRAVPCGRPAQGRRD